MASLKSDVERLDIDKLETTSTDLDKLNNVVEKWCSVKDYIRRIG